MSLILNIDTSTSICSVCLSDDESIISIKEDFEGLNHAILLTPFIEKILQENKLKAKDLNAIAVSKGPGSYTGLRIGVSVAKGMAYALSIPLISVSTLEFMASGYLEENPSIRNTKNTLLCPMIDARRMEVYSIFFDTNLKKRRELKAEIIDSASYMNELNKNKIHIFGDGALKCYDVIKSKNLLFDSRFKNSSRYMASISSRKFKQKKFEDVAYFEPFYLKDFVATTPKNKVLK